MRPTAPLDEETWRHRIRKFFRGLRAPKDSGDYKAATFALERAVAPSFAALTVCSLVLLLLFTFVATQAIPPESPVEVLVVDPETVELDFDEPDLPEPEPLDPLELADPSMTPPDTALTLTPERDMPPVTTDRDREEFAAETPMMTRSPIVLRGLYGSRTPEGRAAAVSEHGGTPETETAVVKALVWLKQHQDEDGSWRSVSTVDHLAMTGLATLTFLAHGVTPEHAEFGDPLRKALQYLVASQRDDGLFPGGRGYTHGIVAYAVSEAYAMTRIMELRDVMEKAIGIIIDGQQTGGGYDYNFAQGERWDTSVAGWMVQAMKAAHMTGANIPGLDRAMENAARFLIEDAWTSNNNMFLYSGGRGRGTWNMTGVGVLSLQLLGRVRHPHVRAGLASLAEHRIRWNPEGGNHVYGWYYVTQAFFHQGGNLWKRWNDMFAEQLVAAQHEDGHWTGGHRGGPVYTTTLNALMLQVYYRYLPTFQKIEEIDPETDATSAYDVEIEIY